MANAARRFSRYLPIDRSRLRYWLIILGLFLADISPMPFTFGTVLLACGMLLHLWAKGSLHQNRILCQGGPYRWVRHPFYLGNALIDLGLCLIINRLDVLVIYSIFWLIAYFRAIEHEELRLGREFGEAFQNYRERTPCLLPWKVPASDRSTEGFSWRNRNIATGSEVPRLLRLAGYPLLLIGASEFHDVGSAFWTELAPGFIAAWLFVLLCCASFVVKCVLRKQRLSLPRWSASDAARNLFVLGILTFAFFFPFMELEMEPSEFGLAAVLVCAICLHLFVSRRTMIPDLATLTEGAILIVICFVAELPWLSFLPMSYYAALWLNARLSEANPAQTSNELLPRSLSYLRLQAILTIGIGLMLWKELYDDLSGLLFLFHWSSS